MALFARVDGSKLANLFYLLAGSVLLISLGYARAVDFIGGGGFRTAAGGQQGLPGGVTNFAPAAGPWLLQIVTLCERVRCQQAALGHAEVAQVEAAYQEAQNLLKRFGRL